MRRSLRPKSKSFWSLRPELNLGTTLLFPYTFSKAALSFQANTKRFRVTSIFSRVLFASKELLMFSTEAFFKIVDESIDLFISFFFQANSDDEIDKSNVEKILVAAART